MNEHDSEAWKARDTRPEGYEPPTGTHELLARYEAGERYFVGAHLSGANLAEKDLRWANFMQASLTGADLSKADLRYADFYGANLSKAKFGEANLSEEMYHAVHFDDADLSEADLTRANLTGAWLYKAKLSKADLSHATCLRTKLLHANLAGANLEGTDLGEAVLEEANLEHADLRDVHGARLNSTFTRNAKFSPYAKDPWSVLRRNYTGPRFVFHLLLLVTFILPYVARTMMWVSVNRSQTAMMQITAHLTKAAADLEAAGNVGSHLLAQAAARLSEIQPCLTAQCRKWLVWQILLGVDRGWSYWTLAGALVLYNVSRGLLTWRVGPLREEEERSGYSPALKEYVWLIWPHRIVTVLLYVAIASFLWHAYNWLSVPVWLPG